MEKRESEEKEEKDGLFFVGCYLLPETVAEIDRRATADGRSRANWMRRFFEQALKGDSDA